MRHKENNLIFETYKTVCEGKYSPEELKKIAARSTPKDKLNKMDFVPIKEDDVDVSSEDEGEYDQEGDMAKDQLDIIGKAAEELSSILSDEENLPEWVQEKITLAKSYVDGVRDYMLAQKGDSVSSDHGSEDVASLFDAVD
jgi:hypothetical protein